MRSAAARAGAESAFGDALFAAPPGCVGDLGQAGANGGKRAMGSLAGKPGNRGGNNMNWDQIEGKWKRFTGSARERWGNLTDNDWETIAGKKDQLVGRIQERYGVAKAEAEKQADEWSQAQTQFENERHAAAHL
jgi:uncharacterized protein YjbJ (UPF0337 family)